MPTRQLFENNNLPFTKKTVLPLKLLKRISQLSTLKFESLERSDEFALNV